MLQLKHERNVINFDNLLIFISQAENIVYVRGLLSDIMSSL